MAWEAGWDCKCVQAPSHLVTVATILLSKSLLFGTDGIFCHMCKRESQDEIVLGRRVSNC